MSKIITNSRISCLQFEFLVMLPILIASYPCIEISVKGEKNYGTKIAVWSTIVMINTIWLLQNIVIIHNDFYRLTLLIISLSQKKKKKKRKGNETKKEKESNTKLMMMHELEVNQVNSYPVKGILITINIMGIILLPWIHALYQPNIIASSFDLLLLLKSICKDFLHFKVSDYFIILYIMM